MVIFISYEEAQKYVKEQYGQRIELSRVSQKELCVSYVKRIVIKDVGIDVNVRIDEVRPDGLTVTYKGGLALDMIISGALGLFLEKLPELSAGIRKEDNHRVVVNLSEIAKAKPIVEKVALRDIEVEATGLSLSVVLK